MAIDCPALPADADLSRLWVVVTSWTPQGPQLHSVEPYARDTIHALRHNHTLWDLALGDDADDAARSWQAQIDALRAEASRREAEEHAAAQALAQHRAATLAALRNSDRRAARRALADE